MTDTSADQAPDQTPIYTQLLAEHTADGRLGNEPAPTDQPPDDQQAAESGPTDPGGGT